VINKIFIYHLFIAPTKSPDIVQAFSTGPYKIFIEWSPIPLPFVHGDPLGFRVKISKVGEDDPFINTTGMDVKYFDVENLQPLTNYSLQVLEFNKNGDGPLSSPVYVQTMPKSKNQYPSNPPGPQSRLPPV